MHVHGEELPQPHLHVLATARPLNPDGTVNRESSLRPFASKASVRNERANVAALVNEHCAPEVRFHPGKLADTGIERPPKRRIPQGAFRTGRKQIRAEPEKAAEIEAEMYAASRAERAPLHGERTAAWLKRAPVIEKAKAAGRWPPRSQRREQQITISSWRRAYDLTKERADAGAVKARAAEASVVALTGEKQQAETRADTAEASVTTLTGEKQQAETRAEKAEGERDGLQGRVGEMEARQVEPLQPLQLTERQREMLVGVCARKRIDGDPVHNARVQLLAFAAHHEERDKAREERKRREAGDEAAAREAVQAALANERPVQEEIAAAEQRGREAEKRETTQAQQAAVKRRVEAAAKAEEQRLEALAAAQAADAARRAALLKDNLYAEMTQGELRKAYREDVRSIEMHQVILNRARARKVWPASEEKIAEAGERQKQRSAVAEAKGWDIGQPPRTQSNTQRSEGR